MSVVSLDYGLVRRYIRLLDLTPTDVFFDLGCGPGRPLCIASRYTVSRCVGVEMSPEIAERARHNVSSLKGRLSDAIVVTADAISVDYDEGTAFWMYNPFGPRTVSAVLCRIKESLERRPREVRFCYVNPEAESAFHACDWLRPYLTERPFLHRMGVATFWRSQAHSLR